MSTKAQIQTQAKAPAAPTAARIPQPPNVVPEHEADRPDIATKLEDAARLGHSLGAISVDSSAPPIIQRQELPEEEEEEELQMKRELAAIQRQQLPEEEEEEEELQMKPQSAALQRQGRGAGFRLDDETAGRINRARGGGQPLDSALQQQMGAALGYDFSGVRVHTDCEADALNNLLGARAFTTGPDIFFGKGEYSPRGDSGRRLLSHELVHVVQQGMGRLRGSGGGMTVRPSEEASEKEAEGISQRVGRGGVRAGGTGQPTDSAVSRDAAGVVQCTKTQINEKPADMPAEAWGAFNREHAVYSCHDGERYPKLYRLVHGTERTVLGRWYISNDLMVKATNQYYDRKSIAREAAVLPEWEARYTDNDVHLYEFQPGFSMSTFYTGIVGPQVDIGGASYRSPWEQYYWPDPMSLAVSRIYDMGKRRFI